MRKNLQNIQLQKSESELENILDFASGFSPYLRGIDATMYVTKPWTIVNDSDVTEDDNLKFIDINQNNLVENINLIKLYIDENELNNISISLSFKSENETDKATELSNTILFGLEFLKLSESKEINLEKIEKDFSICFSTGKNHFLEIAKLRAARLIWAKLMKINFPKNEKLQALKIHCQTSESTNRAKNTTEALSSVFGGIQYMETSSINLQHFLMEETKITKTVDPWAGSFYVENLTHELAEKTWNLIQDTKNFNEFD